MYHCASLSDGESRLRLSFRVLLFSVLPCILSVVWVGLAATPARAQAPNTELSFEVYEREGLLLQRFAERRNRLLATMPDSSVAVFFSADVRNRQNDVDYPYRQSSDMLYLTGISVSGAKLMLIPSGLRVDGDTALHRAILFLPVRDTKGEIWTGVRPGPKEAESQLGFPKALPDSMWKPLLGSVLRRSTLLYITQWPTPVVREPLFGERVDVAGAAKAVLAELYPQLDIKSQRSTLSAMREIKDTDEMALMQKAVDITTAGFLETMRQAKSGMAEYELESIMEDTFQRLGAHDVGYPSIVGSGPNSCILHYTDNRRTTEKGDLVMMDCGAEYFGYTADITRTFPIRGTFDAEQKLIYNIVLEAQDSAIAACTAGSDWRKPHSRAVSVIRRRLMEEEIIKNADDYLWYFMHGTSHYLGLDVHDAGTYGTLQAGTVLTVEPGIYIPAGSPCDSKWWNIGIRIEDNVMITEKGPIVLSRELPRTVPDIERVMRAGRQ